MSLENLDQGRHSEEVAHQEANELRSLLAGSAENGKTLDSEREAMAEPYNDALQKLESLREAALTSTNWDTAMEALSNNPLIGSPFLSRVIHALRGSPAEIGKRWQESEAVVHGELEKLIGKALTDLQKLNEAGKKFGEREAHN